MLHTLESLDKLIVELENKKESESPILIEGMNRSVSALQQGLAVVKGGGEFVEKEIKEKIDVMMKGGKIFANEFEESANYVIDEMEDIFKEDQTQEKDVNKFKFYTVKAGALISRFLMDPRESIE
mmetsp:Transcript_10248/g.22751  ORF Transcript_10248/g.22751 Transcript_10248/m.22751 type:complete len:125 (-) Transcript_10248:217-591(-)